MLRLRFLSGSLFLLQPRELRAQGLILRLQIVELAVHNRQLTLQLRGDNALIELPLARRADRGEHQRRPADGQRGLFHVCLAQHLHDRPLAEPCGVCQLRHAQHFRTASAGRVSCFVIRFMERSSFVLMQAAEIPGQRELREQDRRQAVFEVPVARFVVPDTHPENGSHAAAEDGEPRKSVFSGTRRAPCTLLRALSQP